MDKVEAMNAAVAKIKSEHRSLAAVLQGMQYLTRRAVENGEVPNFPVLRAMTYYIDAFPERLHHPKEDRYLFRLLRERTAEETAIINVLEHQHAQGEGRIRELEQALLRYEAGGAQYAKEFADLVNEYANFHWRHMRFEEDIVLPLAQRVLNEDDWREIATAFANNEDPLFGASAEREFENLFSRIAAMAPAPIGLGATDTGKP
jgi:hemerythrin-like domain-containing protein